MNKKLFLTVELFRVDFHPCLVSLNTEYSEVERGKMLCKGSVRESFEEARSPQSGVGNARLKKKMLSVGSESNMGPSHHATGVYPIVLSLHSGRTAFPLGS